MSEQTRSHRRLLYALGLSSIILATLLVLAPGFIFDSACSDPRCLENPDVIEVNITQPEPERVVDIMPPAYKSPGIPPAQQQVAQSRDVETANNKQEESAERSHDLTATRDWHEIASESASQSVADRFAQEKIRKSMWSNTGSVMFKDTGEFDFREPATVIADLEFRIPVGVLGIGITIGGCFIGIPLAGIPVEKRTVGPNLIYCTDIYE